MTHFIADLRKAWINLSSAQGFVITIVSTLGLTLGAVITMFSLNWVLLFDPLPYPEQNSIVYIEGNSEKNGSITIEDRHILPLIESLYSSQEDGDFSSMALVSYNDNIIKSLPSTPRVGFTYVTPEYFKIFGAQMALGRGFDHNEGIGQRNPSAVISYGAWEKYYARDPNIIGKTLKSGDTNYSIVGVSGEGFSEPELLDNSWETQVWLPWDYDEGKLDQNKKNNWNEFVSHYKVVALLKGEPDENHIQQISAQLSRRLNDERIRHVFDPTLLDLSVKIRIDKLHQRLLGNHHHTSLLMLASAIALLFIASANIVNLFFSRSAAQQRNLAIRASVGATMANLFRFIFAETLIITSLSGVLSVLVAILGNEAIKALAANHFPRIESMNIGLAEIVFLLLVTLMLATAFALFVRRGINYRLLVQSLKSSGKGGGLQISRTTHQALIASQVFVACLLLTFTLVIFNASLGIWTAPKHVATEGRYLVRLNMHRDQGDQMDPRKALWDFVERFPQHPNIDSMSIGLFWPYSGTKGLVTKSQGSLDSKPVSVSQIDHEWLSLFDVKLLRGRDFTSVDVFDGNKVVIISEHAASALFPGEDAIGQRLFLTADKTYYEVIGVVDDVHLPGERARSSLLVPVKPRNNLIFKTEGEQSISREKLSEIIVDINPSLYISMMRDWDDYYEQKISRDKIIVMVSFAVSLLTLFLVGIGLFGIINYQVRLRRYELGVRMALGANASRLIRFIISETGKPASVGAAASIVIGISLILGFSENISRMVPLGFAAWLFPAILAMTFIASIVLVTCYIPLRSIVYRPAITSLRGS